MNFPYTVLLVMPWKCILICFRSIAPGHQPAGKSLRRIIPMERLVLLNPPDTNHCQKIFSPAFYSGTKKR